MKPGSRPATRSPRRAAATWRRSDDPPWSGYPALPAAGDSLGFLRWRSLSGDQPPGQAAWKWTAADRSEARKGMLALAQHSLASAAEPSCGAERDCDDGDDDDFDGASDEKDGVRCEEAERWLDVVALMQKFWSEAAAESPLLRNQWDRARAREDRRRRAEARALFIANFGPRRAWPDDPFAEGGEFRREELACKRKAAEERAYWSRREALKFEEVALLLLKR